MGLRDRLDWVPPEQHEPIGIRWITDGFPTKEDGIRMAFDAPVEVVLSVVPQRVKASDIVTLKAREFGELLKRGFKPGEAAHLLHTSVQQLMNKPQTKKVIQEIIQGYHLDAQVRKLLVRAMANKGLLEAQEKEDPKLALEYMKFIADDSEVGITEKQTQNVTVSLDKGLMDLLERTIELPPQLQEATDAEFQDVPPQLPPPENSDEK